MLDVRKLRYFATVAEMGSFTKAARVLHVAQPALSRQIQNLEEEVGLLLFLRIGRQIRLTDAGEAMLSHARTIDRDFERLIEDMQSRKGTPKGKVVLGVPPTLADAVVPRLIELLKLKLPMVALTIVEGLTPVLADWLRSNKADLAILSLATERDAKEFPGLSIEPLTTEDMVVAERTDNGNRGPYTLDELRCKELVVSGMLAAIVQRQLGETAMPFKFILEIDSVQALKTMVLRGQAATILPVSMLGEELRKGTVSARSITTQSVRRQIVLAHQGFRQMTQAGEAMRQFVREQMSAMQAEGLFSLRRW